MRIAKVVVLGLSIMGLSANALAADLWGSDTDETVDVNASDDLWGDSAPKKKAEKPKPAPAKPAPAPAKAEQPKPAPVAQPAPAAEPAPVVAPEPAPEIVKPVRRQEPEPQPVPVVVDTVAPVAEPVVEAVPVADTVADTTNNELAPEFLSEATDSAVVDSAVQPQVVVVDTTKKDTVAAPVVVPVVVDSAKAEEPKPAEKTGEKNTYFAIGIFADGSFGIYDQSLQENSFMVPEFGGGLSVMFGYSHVALRLSGQVKYETIYVSEDAGTVNESILRVGGGAAIRYMTGLNYGLVAEVGGGFYTALTDDILLYQGKNFTWQLKPMNEIPLEIALGYKLPLSPILAVEVDGFFAYELTESMNFAFVNDHKANAWHAGLRLIGWMF